MSSNDTKYSSVSGIERWSDRLRSFFAQPSTTFCVVALVLVWKLVLSSPADPDLFARVGTGKLVRTLGLVPLQDPFAFTAKLPEWIDHEWLSGVVLYEIASRWGDPGLILLKLVLAIWTAILLVRASYIYWPQVTGRIVWVTVCLLEASHLWASTVRCQIFTYCIIALIYYGFAQYRVYGVRRYIALIPCALVALVNMHGGYALAVVLLWLLTLCSFLERRPWRMIAVVAAVSMLAPIATPYGFEKFVTYLLHALSMKRPFITEWEPLYYDSSGLIRVAIIAGCMVLGIVVRTKRRDVHLTAVVALGFSLYCGVSHIRFVGFAMLTAVVFGAGFFSSVVEAAFQRFPRRSALCARVFSLVGLVTLVVMAVQVGVATLRSGTWRLDTSGYPTAAIEWLRKSGSTGKLLVDFNNGSFALWRLYPKFLVSIDGRYEEVYTDETFQDTALAFRAHTPEGSAALKRISPTHILLRRSSESEEVLAALSTEWREVYRDECYSIVTTSNSSAEMPIVPVKSVDLWSGVVW